MRSIDDNATRTTNEVSRYVLDTDILSLFQGGDQTVAARCSAVPLSNLAITVISVEEVMSSWYTHLRKAKSRARLALAYHRLAASAMFLGRLNVLPFPESAIDRFESLKRAKLGVRALDLRIASIVLELGDILVTRNLRDFQHIAGLVIEDWTRPPTNQSAVP